MMDAARQAELVTLAKSGDRDAFMDLYQEFLPRIHDYCYQLTRSRADAEDATSEVFLKAIEKLDSLRKADAFKSWLYSIAHNACMTILRAKGKATPVAEYFDDAEPIDSTIAVADPSESVEGAEIQQLVLDAAKTLNPRDYSVYELSVRQGLTSAEVAKALNVRTAYGYILVNRLKDNVEQALEAVLLARSDECSELRAVVAKAGDDLTPRLRKAVNRHAKTCDVCEGTRSRKASVAAIMGGVAAASPSSAFAASLTSNLLQHWQANGPGTGSGSAGSGLGRLAGISAGIAGLVAGLVLGLASPTTDVPPTNVQPASNTVPSPTIPPQPSSTPAPTQPPRPTQVQTPKPESTSTVIIITSNQTPEPERTRRPRDGDEPTQEPAQATNEPKQTAPPATDPPTDPTWDGPG